LDRNCKLFRIFQFRFNVRRRIAKLPQNHKPSVLLSIMLMWILSGIFFFIHFQ
jgi:hypothetical protein